MKDDKCKDCREANGADFIGARPCTSLGSCHAHNLNHPVVDVNRINKAKTR